MCYMSNPSTFKNALWESKEQKKQVENDFLMSDNQQCGFNYAKNARFATLS